VFPGKVTIRFGEPITFSQERPDNMGAERTELMKRVAAALAELTGFSVPTIYWYEKGIQPPSKKHEGQAATRV
jgi:transcriptional regulator with XRE-family HTH domain